MPWGVKIGSNITISSGTISLTKDNITAALGYTPPTTNTTYSVATTSANGLMSAADKIKSDATNIAYGTCSTAAETAAKVVTLTGNTNWQLITGSIITVKFTETNSAAAPTLNVNSTGAYPIYYNASEYTSSSSYGGYTNRHITYQFDGTYWVFISWGYDSNSDTKVTQAAAITTAGEYPVVLGYNTSTSTVTNTLKKTSTLKYNPNTKILTAPTFKGALSGNASTATKLATARNIQIDLASTSAASFNGSEDITPGITGTLDIGNGGTGATSAVNARINLGFNYGSSAPSGTVTTGDGSVYFQTGGDAVIEVGTSGIWTYRKWASGIAECWFYGQTFAGSTPSSFMGGDIIVIFL